jgi:alpha-mannosidase
MRYQELLILLPCHSLEDFPTHYDGEEGAGLLAHWTALWHPTLIASAEKAPQWVRVDDPPNDFPERLIAVPNVAKERLPTGYAARAKENGATVLRNLSQRPEILAAALEPIGGSNVDDDLAADFLALGYAYLQIQLLTRQMRYSSSLDDPYFKSKAVAAAVAAVAGDAAGAREHLSTCYSLLAEERDRYYPVDAFLIDITLVAETTLGPALLHELQRRVPTNLLLGGQLVAQLTEREPACCEALRAQVAQGTVGILGGEDRERRLPLMSLEDARSALAAGAELYERHLGSKPRVFGRRRFGLSPALPQVLRKSGFQGVFHATLEDGRFPEGTQLKVGWEASDGTTLDAIARPPLDAALPKTFLQMASKLGESMDQDHVATLLFAHWPGQASPFYDDLQRATKYSTCLGRFVTVDEYFAESNRPGQMDRFEVDRYKSPYLKQAVIRKHVDPISSVARYWQRRATWEAAEAMHTLADLVTGRPSERPSGLLETIVHEHEQADASEFDDQLRKLHSDAAHRLAQCICPQPSRATGYLVLNPYACVRRTGIGGLAMPHVPLTEKAIYATGEDEQGKQAVVDVPGFGYVWVPAGDQPQKHRKPPQLLAEGPNVLRNEFFEAAINTTTGTLQTVHEYGSRRNRLSQQLGLRTPGPAGKPGDVYRDPDETALYSVMGADSVEITSATPALGEITVRGRLMNQQGETQADFKQVYRVWRGSRVLRIDIELYPKEELKSDPWNSYFACRFAWGDEAAELFRTVHQQRHLTTTKYLESPHYIEIDLGDKRTTILTGGLPFHRRSGPAMLDSLLQVRGETAHKFTVGIGIDLPHPMHEAMALLAPPVAVPLQAAPPTSGQSGWLLHIDSRNVISTAVEPLVQGDRVIGFRARLLETAGRAGEITLSAFRGISRANKLDFQGEVLRECPLHDGKAKLSMSAHEWAEIECYW